MPTNPATATVVYDFMGGVLPAGATLTRASIGWALNAAGVLTQFAINVPRFGFTDAGIRGLLNERAATNEVRNSTMVGAAAGTPGTAPTGWTTTGSGNGLTRSFATGTEDGMPYLDVRYVGTPTANINGSIILPIGPSLALSTPTELWSHAFYMKLLPGPILSPAQKFRVIMRAYNEGGTQLIGGSSDPLPIPVGGALHNARQSAVLQAAIADPAIASVGTGIGTSGMFIGIPVDYTFRYAAPNLVRGDVVGSSIQSTNAGAITRALDVLTLSPPADVYDIVVERQSGITKTRAVVIGAGGYVVPNSNSPVKKITVSGAEYLAGKATPVVIAAGGTPVYAGNATPRLMVTSGPVYDGPATPIQIVTGRVNFDRPATPMMVVTGRPVLAGPAIPVL